MTKRIATTSRPASAASTSFSRNPRFHQKRPNRGREIGGRMILADPLAEDWLTNLHRVAEHFRMALKYGKGRATHQVGSERHAPPDD